MAELKNRIRNSLNETRILVLVAQVIVGFEYQSVFQHGFDALPGASRTLRAVALGLLLLALALLLAPASFHRLVEGGHNSLRLERFTSVMSTVALIPFAFCLGADFYCASQLVVGNPAAIVFGSVLTGMALFLWYGLELLRGRRGTSEKTGGNPEQTPLKDRIEEVLMETRMVLPGAQALIGFQFSIMLMEKFDELTPTLKVIHLASLAVTAVSIMLLMAPAAYHRIVERGENSEELHRVGSWMLLLAMAFLALGIAGDFLVLLWRVTGSAACSIGGALAIVLLFYGLWFGYTLYRARAGRR
jgi:hypothetical protein